MKLKFKSPLLNIHVNMYEAPSLNMSKMFKKTTVFNDYLQIAQSQSFGGTKIMAALRNDLNILH